MAYRRGNISLQLQSVQSVVIKLINNHNSQMFADITEGITGAERQTRYVYVHN